jgi:hypothetical protein
MYELGEQFTIPNLSRHLYVIGRSALRGDTGT